MQEVINGMRKIVKPYLAKQLKKINFEGCGNTDKAEFETDFEIVLTLAEKALAIPSAEPCEDAISRQAVLDYIDKMPSELTADGRRMIRRRTLEEYISDTLSSVKQEPKWIPVSEKLPDDEEDVLFCAFDHIMLGYHPRDWKSTHFAERGSWELQKNVEAWMTLPSPYSTDGMASDKLTTDDGEPDGTGGQIFCP